MKWSPENPGCRKSGRGTWSAILTSLLPAIQVHVELRVPGALLGDQRFGNRLTRSSLFVDLAYVESEFAQTVEEGQCGVSGGRECVRIAFDEHDQARGSLDRRRHAVESTQFTPFDVHLQDVYRLTGELVIQRRRRDLDDAAHTVLLPQAPVTEIAASDEEGHAADAIRQCRRAYDDISGEAVEPKVVEKKSMIDRVALERVDFSCPSCPPCPEKGVVPEICTDVDDGHARPYVLSKEMSSERLDTALLQPPEISMMPLGAKHLEAVDRSP
jgi:hypothetical protein